MSKNVASFFEQWESDLKVMQKEVPEVVRGFGGLFQSVMAEGARTAREKELIAP